MAKPNLLPENVLAEIAEMFAVDAEAVKRADKEAREYQATEFVRDFYRAQYRTMVRDAQEKQQKEK